jgi:hypothetical protein
LCPSAKRQGLGASFEERAEREEEVVGQGGVSLSDLQRKRRINKRERRKWSFGRNSFEF